ncbi:MAG: methyltransferase domain-containing protein [Phycisphaeraceae bacterium]|nr:methyltransferase domain-containing protein [Phycisphaeraceae bacterium]
MSVLKEYVLGTGRDELERLGLQHRLWSDAAHTLWRLAGVRPGMRILDVGSGPGFATFDLALLVGARGHVHAIDESEPFIEHIAAQAAARSMPWITASRADVHALDSAPGNTSVPDHAPFDLAFARWVLCFVKDPAAVVRGVARSLKPGGAFMIHDYHNYEAMRVAPRGDAFAKAVRATGASWRARGGDPDVMGRIGLLCRDAGLHIEHLAVHQRLCRPGDSMWAWPETFWSNFLPVLVKMGLLTESDRAAWHAEWADLSRSPDTFITLPAVYEVIARKPVA